MVKRALLIGINYNNTNAQLNGCINDVYNIRNFLKTYCEYSDEHIRVLTDQDILPTRANIINHVNWLVSACLPGDTLFFHYSGHGSFVRDNSGDESDGRDEVLVPLDYKTAGMLSDDWLFANLVQKVPSQVNLWAIVDACHSGTMIDLKYNYKSLCSLKRGKITPGMEYKSELWNNRFSFSLEKTPEVQGNICLFSGALDREVAADDYIAGSAQGAFTHCLLESLNGKIVKLENNTERFKSGSVKLREILKEVNCRLDIKSYAQNSQLSVSKQTDLERTLDL
jgi:hypothetical protein